MSSQQRIVRHVVNNFAVHIRTDRIPMGDNPHVILRPFLKVELHHTEIVKWILLGVVQQNYSEDFSGCQSIACVEFLPVRCSPDETARIGSCNHGHIEIQLIVPPVLSAERCEATLFIATVTYQCVAVNRPMLAQDEIDIPGILNDATPASRIQRVAQFSIGVLKDQSHQYKRDYECYHGLFSNYGFSTQRGEYDPPWIGPSIILNMPLRFGGTTVILSLTL